MRNWATALLLLLCGYAAEGQITDTTGNTAPSSVYHVNPWVSGGIALVGGYTNIIGIPKVKDKPLLSEEELGRLVSDGVGWLDRSGLRQNVHRREQAHRVSDFLMYGTASLPFLLVLDKKIRPDYLDVSLMYLETVAITSNLYTYSPLGPTFIDRYRPLAFYEDVPLSERQAGNQRNSFYSGHVATTAMGAFFTAKVLYDHHPEWGRRRWWLFGAATVPTAFAGLLRLRALKHFPTDLVAGGLIGAGMGVLIPEIHRRWNNRLRVKAGGDTDAGYLGLTLNF